MKKKLLTILSILFLSFISCACHRPDTIILFNKYPITKDNLLDNSSEFVVGKRFHYIFISEKPLEADSIRVRILKRDDKANYEAIKLVYSNDFRLNKDQIYYYTDYIVINEAGYYCMLVYATNKLDAPLIKADFRVK